MTVAVIGNAGTGELGGQIVKTQELLNYLENNLDCNLSFLDVNKVGKNPYSIIFSLYKLVKKNKVVIIILATRGYSIIMPILYIVNLLFKRRIFEFVIGGVRHKKIKKNKWLCKIAKSNERIYVESQSMVKEYEKMGFKNCEYLPNFKSLIHLKKINKDKFHSSKIKVCTFSRVVKEKGIEVAIEAVKQVYEKGVNIEFDIYGDIVDEYADEFAEMKKDLPEYINYRGVIDTSNSTYVLSNYSILLFPTLYKTEGFPSTIIDAFAAGLPMICSKVGVIPEIIYDGREGFLVEDMNAEKLAEKIYFLDKNRGVLERMAQHSLEQYKNYQTETVLSRVLAEILV